MVVLNVDIRHVAQELVDRLEAEIEKMELQLCCSPLSPEQRAAIEFVKRDCQELLDKAKELAALD